MFPSERFKESIRYDPQKCLRCPLLFMSLFKYKKKWIICLWLFLLKSYLNYLETKASDSEPSSVFNNLQSGLIGHSVFVISAMHNGHY